MSGSPKNCTTISTIVCLYILSFASASIAGDALSKLSKELNQLIDSSKVSVVTVAAKFSHEIYVEKESGILSFFKTERQKHPISYINLGTGLIIDGDGHIVTRSSIVYESDYNKVTLADGREVSARFVGHDAETGFAVLRIEGSNFQSAKLGATEQVRPGAWIVMIGNSLGAFPSVDFGVINGVRNDGMIQVSANLNPGNNGSPIFDLNGKVVGIVAGRINAAKNVTGYLDDVLYTETTLVYPINLIRRIAADIIEMGYVRKGWLGVVGYYDGWKPKIREIKENSPAQRAGLTKGDIIVNFDNREVDSISELVRMVEYTAPGQKVPVEYLRAKERFQVEVEIGEKSASAGTEMSGPYSEEPGASYGETEFRSSQNIPFDLQQRNLLLEKRVSELERELKELKKALESQ